MYARDDGGFMKKLLLLFISIGFAPFALHAMENVNSNGKRSREVAKIDLEKLEVAQKKHKTEDLSLDQLDLSPVGKQLGQAIYSAMIKTVAEQLKQPIEKSVQVIETEVARCSGDIEDGFNRIKENNKALMALLKQIEQKINPVALSPNPIVSPIISELSNSNSDDSLDTMQNKGKVSLFDQLSQLTTIATNKNSKLDTLAKEVDQETLLQLFYAAKIGFKKQEIHPADRKRFECDSQFAKKVPKAKRKYYQTITTDESNALSFFNAHYLPQRNLGIRGISVNELKKLYPLLKSQEQKKQLIDLLNFANDAVFNELYKLVKKDQNTDLKTKAEIREEKKLRQKGKQMRQSPQLLVMKQRVAMIKIKEGLWLDDLKEGHGSSLNHQESNLIKNKSESDDEETDIEG